MQLDSRISGDTQVVSVRADRIDAAVAIRFKDRMREVTDDGPGRVLLDLGPVEMIDSSGLGAIVAAMKHLGEGRRMDLADLSPLVRKVFRLTRMDTVFRIHPSVEAGLAAAADVP